MRSVTPARATGTAAAVGRVSRNAFTVGAVFALVIAVVLAGPFTGLAGLALGLLLSTLVIAGWTALCRKLVGGQTGDLIGALQALVEIILLAVFMGLIAR